MTSPDPSVFRSPAFYYAVGRSFVIMCLLVPGLATVKLIDHAMHGQLNAWLGIHPKEPGGLIRIYSAPFVHSGWDHLVANSSPLIILGTFVLAGGTSRFVGGTVIITTVSGLGVWFLTPPDYLVTGASGVIFGWIGLLFIRGFIEHTWWHLAVAIIVGLLYGWQLNLLVPKDESISWQGHLFGFLGGLVAAVATRRRPAKPTEEKK